MGAAGGASSGAASLKASAGDVGDGTSVGTGRSGSGAGLGAVAVAVGGIVCASSATELGVGSSVGTGISVGDRASAMLLLSTAALEMARVGSDTTVSNVELLPSRRGRRGHVRRHTDTILEATHKARQALDVVHRPGNALRE